MTKSVATLLVLLTLSPFSSSAQDIDYSDFFGSYTNENAEGFCQPLSDIFGASMNSGFSHHVKAKRLGFEMYIDLIGTMAFISDESRTFTATPEGAIEPKTPREVPTIVGDAIPEEVTGDNGLGYTYPGGYSFSYIPMAFPQLTIGSVFGTQLVVRYFKINLEDYGPIGYESYGINHAVGQWIPLLPLDLSVGFHYHSYSVTDSLTGNGVIVMAKANYDWKILSFYGGLSFESGKTQIKYLANPVNTRPESFELKAANNIRFTVGTMANFGPFKLFADYSLAKQSVVTFGLGFAINEKGIKEKITE